MPLKYENYYVCKKYTELSVEQTIVPGRLHSELCAWGVKEQEFDENVSAISDPELMEGALYPTQVA